MLDSYMVMIAGTSIDRIHTMNNRLLTYDYKAKQFKYIFCHGTFVPKYGNMTKALSLQQNHSTHLILLGGRLKSQGIILCCHTVILPRCYPVTLSYYRAVIL